MARNNKNRFSTVPDQNPSGPGLSDPNIFSFTTPTEIVDLPSGGAFYPAGHPLHGIDAVEIKFMTAKEEDILVNKAYLRKGDVLDRLLQSVIVDKSIEVGSLLVGDKNALVYATRITGFGSSYTTEITCPACTTTTEYEFDLEESYTLKKVPEEIENVTPTTRGTFVVETLPQTQAEVEIKLLSSDDESHRMKNADSKEQNNISYSFVKEYMKSYIVAVNKEQSTSYIDSFLQNAPSSDTRYLRKIINIITPNASLTHNYDCQDCGVETALEVPLRAEFFWPQR
jgi:hypothetical protein